MKPSRHSGLGSVAPYGANLSLRSMVRSSFECLALARLNRGVAMSGSVGRRDTPCGPDRFLARHHSIAVELPGTFQPLAAIALLYAAEHGEHLVVLAEALSWGSIGRGR
jgi:hypothetical protein